MDDALRAAVERALAACPRVPTHERLFRLGYQLLLAVEDDLRTPPPYGDPLAKKEGVGLNLAPAWDRVGHGLALPLLQSATANTCRRILAMDLSTLRPRYVWCERALGRAAWAADCLHHA